MFAHHEVFVHISPQLRPTSIEKEIFPRMARDDDLFAYNLSGTLFFCFKLVGVGRSLVRSKYIASSLAMSQ